MGALTREDMDFELALQRSAEEEPMPTDNVPVIELKKESANLELLSENMDDTHPATSIRELDDQVHYAKELGCDSIEATPALVRSFCRTSYPEAQGFFMYKDIKVYIAGFFDKTSKANKMTIEQKMFGNSKIVGQPIMISEKK